MGSKPTSLLLGLGAVLGAIALGLVPPGPRHEGVALRMLFAEGFCIGGLHNGLYTVAAYIYPASARATGMAAAAGTGRIGAVLSCFTGALSLKFAGPHIPARAPVKTARIGEAVSLALRTGELAMPASLELHSFPIT